MSLLRQFGAMVSNFITRLRKKDKKHHLTLRTTLFVQPLAIILLAFIAIVVVFNIALSYFINEQADSAIDNQYQMLDALFLGKSVPSQSRMTIFATTYMIVDSDFKTQYISTSMDDVEDDAVSEEIAGYLYQHDKAFPFEEDFDDVDDRDEREFVAPQKVARTVTLDDKTYVLEMATYVGKLSDYYISASQGELAKPYYVFVFVDITPARYMSVWVSIVLLVLMGVTGLLASLLVYVTSKKLDNAFSSLSADITRVGNGEMREVKMLPYHEFNEVLATVDRMSQMIDANRRSQQIFFQNASHELRTPLMSIQGYAEGLREGVIKDSQAAADVIYQESQKMGELVDDILTLSKMETTQTKLHLESLVLDDLLYDVSWRLKQKADAKGISFRHDFQDEGVEILVDESLFERAMLNILSNAVRYAKTYISITTCQKQQAVLIGISNDGPAIAEDDLEHLFERFYKGKDGHFGIGLSITKDIIERHQGQIEVTSSKEQTTFSIYLPQKR
ncbi:sensor histidine kinase [Streptococcus sp. zg-JUN1979]|uniref:sensor histidine kinase n=1 Tax=Streptococcus sp. zg-JUN1979 TaxID=3391450 RepID=UPI0039A66C67